MDMQWRCQGLMCRERAPASAGRLELWSGRTIECIQGSGSGALVGPMVPWAERLSHGGHGTSLVVDAVPVPGEV